MARRAAGSEFVGLAKTRIQQAKTIDELRMAHQSLAAFSKTVELELPRNSLDELRRYLDCAVIRRLHSIQEEKGLPLLDTVKGIFLDRPVHTALSLSRGLPRTGIPSAAEVHVAQPRRPLPGMVEVWRSNPFNRDFPRRLTEAEAVEQFRKAVEESTREQTVSKAAARAVLIKDGIYTKSGRLTKKLPRLGGLRIDLVPASFLGYHAASA